MKLLLAGAATRESYPSSEQLTEWGYEVYSCADSKEITKLVEDPGGPQLVLLDWESESFLAPEILASIREQRHESPLYVIATGSSLQESQMIEALDSGAQDYLKVPLDSHLLERKLKIGKTVVLDKQALIDSSVVLERYSQHIDRVAMERAQQLIHAERLSSLGVMSAGIAHEINTPIGYICASLETAKAYWQQAEKLIQEMAASQEKENKQLELILERVPRALGRIDHGLTKVQRLTESLKSFGRASRGERAFVSLNDVVEEACEIASSSTGHVDIILDLKRELAPVSADQQQLEQVLVNLLVNAGHALEETRAATIWVATDNDDHSVYLTVKDNGTGIPPDMLETIWKEFYTTKEKGKGTGLGLAISQGIIREHSGHISVSNREEGGAMFEIRLPVAKRED